MALASLILGLASVGVAFFVHGFNWLAILVGVIGIVCGVQGRKDPSQKGIATTGMVFSIIGMVFGLIVYIACVLIIDGAKDLVEEAVDVVRDNIP